MIVIKRIDESNKNDIQISNEPFALWGKIIPTFDGYEWAYKTELFKDSQVSEMVFPNENYDFDSLKKDYFFVGAYDDNGACVGLAVYKRDWLKYIYLEDLKVSKAYRGQGVGQLLLNEGKKLAVENGYIGIHTVGQDNNLSACLFYIHSGFDIGGFDTRVYKGTSQADKHNIHFYLDL